MRTKWTVWLFVPLLLGLLLSPGSLGENTIHHGEIDDNGGWGDIADDGELAGVAVAYNAGIEETIMQQPSRVTFPVFVDDSKDDMIGKEDTSYLRPACSLTLIEMDANSLRPSASL